ncbi:MAG: hypothetical protein IJH64_07965 [Oscillospiraceae bacterium]|nr:hypothetical protein [Oscillospiraceae bacterium]MBR0452028.1 hypothetical protein [Oscillospiraceae bacterium]
MKKKSILIVLAVLLVFIATTPIKESFAYFTAHDEASGEASVDLTWSTELKEEIKDNEKHITIANTGNTPVIARVKVFAAEYAKITAGDGWIENADGWWYYSKILEVGQSTPTEVYVSIVGDPEYDFEIVVVHESSRVVYKDGSIVKPAKWNYVPNVTVA